MKSGRWRELNGWRKTARIVGVSVFLFATIAIHTVSGIVAGLFWFGLFELIGRYVDVSRKVEELRSRESQTLNIFTTAEEAAKYDLYLEWKKAQEKAAEEQATARAQTEERRRREEAVRARREAEEREEARRRREKDQMIRRAVQQHPTKVESGNDGATVIVVGIMLLGFLGFALVAGTPSSDHGSDDDRRSEGSSHTHSQSTRSTAVAATRSTDLHSIDSARFEPTRRLDEDLVRSRDDRGSAAPPREQTPPRLATYSVQRAISEGDSYYRRGMYKDAISVWEKVTESNPQSNETLRRLAWVRATCVEGEIRDGRVAVKLASDAYGSAKKSEGVGHSHAAVLAAAFAEYGKFQLAVQFCQQAIDLCPDEAEVDLRAKYHAMKVRFQQGHPWRE